MKMLWGVKGDGTNHVSRHPSDLYPGASVFPICVPDEDVELDDSWSCVTTGWGATKATGTVH